MFINGSPFDSNGGLGVHTRYLCDEFRKFEDIELTLICADYYTQEGGLYLMGDKKKRVQPEDWKHEPNHYRLLEVYNPTLTNSKCVRRDKSAFCYHIGYF
jgi:hypothetical protein